MEIFFNEIRLGELVTSTPDFSEIIDLNNLFNENDLKMREKKGPLLSILANYLAKRAFG